MIGTAAGARLDPSRPESAYVRRATGALELVRCARTGVRQQGPPGRQHSVRVHKADRTGAQEPSPVRSLAQAATGSTEFDELLRSLTEAADALDLPAARDHEREQVQGLVAELGSADDTEVSDLMAQLERFDPGVVAHQVLRRLKKETDYAALPDPVRPPGPRRGRAAARRAPP